MPSKEGTEAGEALKGLSRAAILPETPCPIVCTATGFHSDDCRGQLRDKRQQRLPCEAFSESNVPHLIHANQVKNPLCKVNPQYVRMLFHRTRLLLGGMIASQPEIILAHGSRSAK